MWAKLIGYEYDKLNEAKFIQEEIDVAENIINIYIDHNVDKKINSRLFINQVRGLLKS